MVERSELIRYLAEYLDISNIKDFCINGCQVEGKPIINKLATGVTASLKVVKQAVASGADALLVHHGYFWFKRPAALVSYHYQRVACLIKNDVNLFAYHLPLDAHEVVGNNIQLGKLLGMECTGKFATGTDPSLGFMFQSKTSLGDLQLALTALLGRTPLTVGANVHSHDLIERVAICSGAAQDFIEEAANAGAQVYISGEISERTTHIANELGIAYIAAGHHATEKYGVQALGQLLAEKYGLQHEFIDEDNPV